MRPITPVRLDARRAPLPSPKRPGAAPRLSADSRPGHPRNAAPTQFLDWALI
jgi:hypothetical protein